MKSKPFSKSVLYLVLKTWIKIGNNSSFYSLILLFTILVLTPTLNWAQIYPVKHYTINDGLPSNTIRAIFKDSRGIMWIGTDAGLCRFDGLTFKVYNSRNGLASDKAWSICEDENHDLWIGCFGGGISKFDGTKFTSWTTKEGLVNDMVRTIRFFPRFKIFLIGTNSGLSVFDGKHITNYNPEIQNKFSPWVTNEPMDFIEHENDIDAFTFFGEIIQFFPKTGEFILHDKTYRYRKNLSVTNGVSKVFISSNSDTLIGTGRDGFSEFSKNRQPTLFKGIGQIFGYAEDNKKNIWIAAWNDGVGLYENNNGGLFVYHDNKIINAGKRYGIKTKLGWTVFYEFETKQIWYGTEDAGLYIIPEDRLSEFTFKELGVTELNGKDISVSEGKVQILTTDNAFSLRNGIISDLFHAEDLFKLFNKQWNNYFFRLNKLWFKERDRLEDYKNFYDFLVYHSELKPELAKDREINIRIKYYRNTKLHFWHIFYDNAGNTWISSELGLINLTRLKIISGYGSEESNVIGPNNILYTLNSMNLTRIYGLSDSITKVKSQLLTENIAYVDKGQISRRKDKIYFFNELCGLCLIDKDSIYRISKNQKAFRRTFRSLCFDSRDKLILGTQSGNIIIASLRGDSLQLEKEINIPEELGGSPITWLCCDSSDNVFVGTNKGMLMFSLNEINQVKMTIRLFDKEEGLDNYSGFKAVLDDHDCVWLLSPDKLYKINAKLLREKRQEKPLLKLGKIEVNYQSFNWNEHLAYDPWFNIPKPGFSLPYEQRNLSFYFTSLNYANPLKDRFRYRLDGYDADWSSFSSDRKAVFSNIPPGHYTLKVQLMNLNNPEAVSTLEYPFTILTPWYMTWWFYLALTIFIICSVSFYVRNRIRKVKTTEKLKTKIAQEMAELEMRALQSQMNPHFTFNALNAIQCYILIQDTDKALAYLDDFSVLIRRTLENISKKFIQLTEELDYINRYVNLERARFNDKFDKSILISHKIDVNQVLIPPMILQPYIENAIIHGLNHIPSGGKLDISFDLVNECLYCKIEDNGVGRKKSGEINYDRVKKHQSKGTSITADRVQLLNEPKSEKYKVVITDLLDGDGIGNGTRVEITLPIKTSF